MSTAEPSTGQFQVQPTSSLEESPPAVAIVIETGLDETAGATDVRLGDQPYVVAAWQTWEEDGSGFGIRAQAYDAQGRPVGRDVPVNLAWLGNQQAPTISSDGRGRFVIAWQAEDTVEGDYDVVYRTGSLLPVGGVLTLTLGPEEFTIGEGRSPAVAMGRDGRSVIAWESDSPGSGSDIRATVVTPSGAATYPLAAEAGDQLGATVATDGKGGFVVGWYGPFAAATAGSEEEESVAVFGRGLTVGDSGVPTFTSTFLVSNLAAGATYHDVTAPAAAMNEKGRIAVAWQVEGQRGSGSDIVMTVFDGIGEALASKTLVADVRVNDSTMRPQRAPSVGVDKFGDVLVAWQSQHQDAYSWGVLGKHYQIKAKGKPGTPPEVDETAEFLINETVKGPEILPDVAMARSGRAVVAWLGPEVPDHGHDVEEGEGGHEPAVLARWTDEVETRGPTRLYGADGPEMVLANYVGVEDDGAAAAMDDRGVSLVAWQSWRQAPDDLSSSGIFAALVLPGAPTIVPLGRINDVVRGNQAAPDVAVGRTVDGQTPFVVVWQSDQEVWDDPATNNGLGYGVYAMIGRYTEAGSVAGSVRYVTIAEDAGNQVAPAAAMDGAGGFVVVWQSADGADEEFGQGIFARRFDAMGGPLTAAPFAVNSEAYLDQVSPTVAMNEAGEFVVAWVSDHNIRLDPNDTEKSIFVRWYDGTGAEPPPEVLANTYTKDAQEHPDVAIDGLGGFVVAWQSINQENTKVEGEPPATPGVSWGVYARRFTIDTGSHIIPVDADERGEFLVNDTLPGPQRYASIATDFHGNFVVAWQSIRQDGSSWGIFAKDYPAGYLPDVPGDRPVEFQVNTHTMGPQILPVVTRSNLNRATDTYAIYWTGQGPGHTEGVHGRMFRATTPAEEPLSLDPREVDALFSSSPDGGVLGLEPTTWLDESLLPPMLRRKKLRQ